MYYRDCEFLKIIENHDGFRKKKRNSMNLLLKLFIVTWLLIGLLFCFWFSGVIPNG